MSNTNHRATRTGTRVAHVHGGHPVHRVLMGRRPVLAPNGARPNRALTYALLPLMAGRHNNQRLIARFSIVFALALGVLVLAASVLIWLGYALVWLWTAGVLILPPGVGL